MTEFVERKEKGDAHVRKAISKDTLPPHFASNVKVLIVTTSASFTPHGKHNQRNKKSIIRRCELLQAMDPQYLIRFMIAYPPTVWKGGRSMRDGEFRRLLVLSEAEAELAATTFFEVVLCELRKTQISIRQRLVNVLAGKSPHEQLVRGGADYIST